MLTDLYIQELAKVGIRCGMAVGRRVISQPRTAGSGKLHWRLFWLRPVLHGNDELQPRPNVGDGTDLDVYQARSQAGVSDDVPIEVGGHA